MKYVLLIAGLLSFTQCQAEQYDLIRIGKAAVRGTVDELVAILDEEGFNNFSEILYDDKLALIHVAAMNQRHPEVLTVLIERGADIEAEDYRSRNAISVAIDSDIAEGVEILFHAGADYLRKTGTGKSVFEKCEEIAFSYRLIASCARLFELHENHGVQKEKTNGVI